MRVRSSLLLSLVVAVGGCGSSTDVAATVTLDCTTIAKSLPAGAASFVTTADGLKYGDVTVGTGATFVLGNPVSVHYAGCLTNGTRFDANESPTSPLSFTLGNTGIIAGFNEGLTGMKVGGTRQIIIPPALGYGSTAVGAIPPNSTIVFTVNAVSTP